MRLGAWFAASALVALLIPLTSRAEGRVVTIEEALSSTRHNNITWKSLEEMLTIADAGRDIGIAMFLPKLQAEGQWLHLGERNTPDLSGFDVIGTLTQVVITEHPARAADFAGASSGGGFSFDDFVPVENTLAATFSLVVPVVNLAAIPMVQGAYDRYDAAVQRVGYSRDQLLYGVAKAYYSLVTLQGMIESSERSVAAARQHYKSNAIKAELHAATQLEVKRAELELAQAESRKAELVANLERAKAAFRYLTGIEGDFAVTEPSLALPETVLPAEHWLGLAKKQRKDLLAVRIETLAADHDVDGAWTAYLPTGNLIGQVKLDNNEAQRFDTDAFSWIVMATLTMNVWDGGIREADLKIKKASLRQAKLAVEDLEAQIISGVTSVKQSVADSTIARRLAERQLEVAKATEVLTKAGADAGAVTTLEVIDVNTMVFVSEAGLLVARLKEAMAYLDLLAAAGEAVPFGD